MKYKLTSGIVFFVTFCAISKKITHFRNTLSVPSRNDGIVLGAIPSKRPAARAGGRALAVVRTLSRD